MPLCSACPRACKIDRAISKGFCQVGEAPVLARAALHRWEEPCISGKNGSGTVFFSGCSLRCVFCQNSEISRGRKGKEVTAARLREIYFELIAQGAHNINLVTPTHFIDPVLQSLEKPLPVPVVWNSSGYERAESLRRLEGRVQIYLPDLKYLDAALALRYSGAQDYPQYAKAAIDEMLRQTGPFVIGEDGLMKSGVMIRHLILPSNLDNTFDAIDYVGAHFRKDEVLFSLMSQYTPCHKAHEYAEIARPLTREEYDRAESYLRYSPIENGYMQDMQAAGTEEYIPSFNYEGV